MDRVEEIESAIENAFWDRELDADSASGKLDFLFNEAEHESCCMALSTRALASAAEGLK
jgi:hypothetical protein